MKLDVWHIVVLCFLASRVTHQTDIVPTYLCIYCSWQQQVVLYHLTATVGYFDYTHWLLDLYSYNDVQQYGWSSSTQPPIFLVRAISSTLPNTTHNLQHNLV